MLAAGAVSVFMHHDNIMGIDFTGGDEMTISFVEKIDGGELDVAAEELGLGEVNPVYQTLIGEEREVLKIKHDLIKVEQFLVGLQAAFPEAGLEEEAITQIGASVSTSIQWNAMWSVIATLGGILLYVALRFEMGYGIGAVIATVYDVFMTIGIFVICGALGLFVGGQF